ncbi:MAG: PIG-L deacetylase family protein [Geminicoccaceae bacterium]
MASLARMIPTALDDLGRDEPTKREQDHRYATYCAKRIAEDEVLGAGGTIARLAAAGIEVTVTIVTRGQPPMFSEEHVRCGQAEVKAAHNLLGVRETILLNQPAAGLNSVPYAYLNRAFGQMVRDLQPATMLLPFIGDMHLDHQLVFLSSLVAVRPHSPVYPAQIYCYETLSETNWNAPFATASFTPNVYVDISSTLDQKLDAMRYFRSQLFEFPHERSIDALRALAMSWGSTVHRQAAEAFVAVRQVV